jgi:hypothetical protein
VILNYTILNGNSILISPLLLSFLTLPFSLQLFSSCHFRTISISHYPSSFSVSLALFIYLNAYHFAHLYKCIFNDVDHHIISIARIVNIPIIITCRGIVFRSKKMEAFHTMHFAQLLNQLFL